MLKYRFDSVSNLSWSLFICVFSDYLFSLGKLTGEQVSKTAMQLKSVLEDKVIILVSLVKRFSELSLLVVLFNTDMY